MSLTRYIYAFAQGFNVSFIASGTTGSGKSYLLEGNRTEPGLILYSGETLFNHMEKKRSDASGSRRISGFNYTVRIKYVEIIDEEVSDLLSTNFNTDLIKVVNNDWEGPSIVNATWITVSSISEYNDFFLRGMANRNKNANEFGRLSTKATALFTVELTQLTDLAESNEQIVSISKFCFIDLPGVEILDESQETVENRQGPTLNKSIFSFNNLVNQLAANTGSLVLYDTSTLGTLMRDALGGNAYTLAIHTLQYGDLRGSAVNLK